MTKDEEPVAWVQFKYNEPPVVVPFDDPSVTPLYTTPPQRTWVGLDAFDRMFIRTNCTTLFQQHHDEKTNTTYIGEKTNWDMLFEAIEAKLREKNGG